MKGIIPAVVGTWFVIQTATTLLTLPSTTSVFCQTALNPVRTRQGTTAPEMPNHTIYLRKMQQAAPQAPRTGDHNVALDQLMTALWWVEAGGRLNPPDGDDGASIGPYQIQRAYWKDAGVSGRYEDCRDVDYARRVMLAYWKRYVPEALTGCDTEVLARTHNGGPQGATKAATLAYWHRVRARMEEISGD
jgi:hypothetical protein